MALVGPNGSGKSTLLKMLLGRLAPDREAPGSSGSPRRVRSALASRVRAAATGAGLGGPGHRRRDRHAGRLSHRGWWRHLQQADRAAVAHAITSVGLGDLAGRPVNKLSGGQQQRAFIARAFASEPELLVLDEPIAGVDAESQRRFRDSLAHLISDHDAGVLLVSHELSAVADELDRVIVLKETVLFDGPPTSSCVRA